MHEVNWMALAMGFATAILVNLLTPHMETWRRRLSSLLACVLVGLILASIHWHHEQIVRRTLLQIYETGVVYFGDVPPADGPRILSPDRFGAVIVTGVDDREDGVLNAPDFQAWTK